MSLGRRIRLFFHGGDLEGSAPNPRVTQARGLRETAGPTTLTMGAVADGEFLKRDGLTITSDVFTVDPTATVIDETGAPLTLDSSHNGAVVLVDDDVTVPDGLPVGFNVMLLQTGASAVEIIESSTTVNNRQGHAHIAGQFGVATLLSYATDVFVLGGDTDT